MPKPQPRAPSTLEGAIARTLASPAWVDAASDNARARLVAETVERALGAQPPGSELAEAYRRALRNQRIRAMFDGRNYRELAGRFGLTQRQLRRILHRHCGPKK